MKKFNIFLSVIILLFSCTAPKLALDNDFNINKDEYAVNGSHQIFIKEKLNFGQFRTIKVKRSWTTATTGKSSWGIGNINISKEYINKKQTIHFQLTDGLDTSFSYCVTHFNSKELVIGNRNSIVNYLQQIIGNSNSYENTYYMELFINHGSQPWELLLDNKLSQTDPEHYFGYFARCNFDYYTIYPITSIEKNNKVANVPFGSIGYQIKNKDGKTVAAVSLMDKGVVYLGKVPTDEKFLLANLCTALLLRSNID
jgi:hypothetical protein